VSLVPDSDDVHSVSVIWDKVRLAGGFLRRGAKAKLIQGEAPYVLSRLILDGVITPIDLV
jgi:hypothetical protein